MTGTLIVIAKAPAAGRSKTRLSPPLSPEGAAALAAAALEDTLEAATACAAWRRVLALDGDAGGWVPRDFELIDQRGDGLGERLASAFEDVGGPALLIGMDTPQVSAALLDHAFAKLAQPETDAVIGPALDGGYWAIGFERPVPGVFAGVPMSSDRTCEAQLARLGAAGLRTELLPAQRDVDLIADARVVAQLAPSSRFARALGAHAT
jgi:hypothetical protein